MKIYKFNNLIINLEEVNYIIKQQTKYYNDEYYLIFSMKNGSEFCSSSEFEEEIDERIDCIMEIMEGN